jgi:glycosyltransferase involved in cell wall biosynthesis
MSGIGVTRVALYPSHDTSPFRRIVNYGSFAASAALYGLLEAQRADVIYAYHPPLTVGMAAGLIRTFRGTPVVYDVQDLWPDAVAASAMMPNSRLLTLLGTVAKGIYGHLDRLVVQSDGFKRTLVARGIEAARIRVIGNWCDAVQLRQGTAGASPWPADGRFRILFAGGMGRAQGLDAVLDAAALLQEDAANVVFSFLGGGVESERLKASAAGRGLSNVEFLPRVPMAEVGRYLQGAQVLLVHLKADPLFEITIPSKVQAYMAMGRPMLMAMRGDAAELAARARCAEIAEPENAASIAAAARRLAAQPSVEREAMGARGLAYYEEHLSFRAGVDQFTGVFEEVIAARAGRHG